MRRAAALIVTLALAAMACTDGGSVDPADISFPAETTSTGLPTINPPPQPSVSVPATEPPPVIPTGGLVSVGVWGEPDPAARTLTGAMIRSLTQPQLFTPATDGSWEPSLVEPGSDVDGPEFRSATFRLRQNAVWSDGSPILAGHLFESRDARFVNAVDHADDGRFTVTFNQPLPNWRRLWSGDSIVAPPRDGLFGGPWRVESFDPDLEAVLVPNLTWWGEGPFLDGLRLVVVPDQGVMLDLFEDGVIDVVAPNAVTGRLPILQELAPGRVDTAFGGGWWVGLVADPDEVDSGDRMALLAAIDPAFFVGALMKDEGVAVPSLGGTAVDYTQPDLGTIDEVVTITAPDDVPMIGAAERAILLAIRDAGGTVPELRDGTSDLAEDWIATGEAEAHLALNYDGPGGPCWTCRFAEVDETAARIADGGGATMDALLASQAVVRVIWRPVQAVAWADGLNGVAANGWAITPAWNAHEWWIG